jgi:hypothetical protein
VMSGRDEGGASLVLLPPAQPMSMVIALKKLAVPMNELSST